MIKGQPIEIDTKSWERSVERFVGFIDIMGFKDLVARNNHEDLYIMMRRIRTSTFQNTLIHGVDLEDSGSYESNIYITTYSDSIIVYSKDNSEQSLNSFINAVSGLTNDLIINEVPHKGTVAYGIMTLDFKNSIFFGQPLIDAYLLHDELSFYGIVVHASADHFIKNCNNDHVFEYDCPFKNGVSKHLTILPELLNPNPMDDENYQKCYSAVQKFRLKTSGSLRIYIDKTLCYLESYMATQIPK